MTYSSVALLVDGDNISSQLAGQILRRTADLGPHQIRRVYCNSYSLGSWSSASSFRKILSGSGKNGSDLVLSIEAMTFALRDNVPAFAIASSDRDFSHLAHALREMGHHVVGLGEEKAPLEFHRACTDFIELRRPAAKVAAEQLGKTDTALRTAFDKEDPDDRGMLIKDINSRVRKYISGFKISDSDDQNWDRYFKNRPQLYSIFGEAEEKRVRIARESD